MLQQITAQKQEITPAQQALQDLGSQFITRKAEFEAVLPSNCSFERFVGIVRTAIMQNNELLKIECRPSLFMSCFKAAQDGLLPDGREAALVIYKVKQQNGNIKQQVQYMPMVAGILKKMRTSGELSSISAHVVFERDEFDYSLGDNEYILHKPALAFRGKPVCVYAIVKIKDGAVYREVMSFEEIEKIRSISRTRDGITWRNHWAEMAKKTVIRRISKRLPLTSDQEQVIRRDDEMFEFNNNITSSNSNNTVDIINNQVANISNSIEAPATVDDINMLDSGDDFEIDPELIKKADSFAWNLGSDVSSKTIAEPADAIVPTDAMSEL